MRFVLTFSLLLLNVFYSSGTVQPGRFIILNGDYQVKAQGYNIYPIRVPNEKVATLEGRLSVYGAADQDVELCVFDQNNLERFVNRQSASALFCSGRVKLKTFTVTIPAGSYSILLNNSYSVLTAKTVNVFAGLSFAPAGNPQRQPFIPNSLHGDEYADATYDSKGKLISLKDLFPPDSDNDCKTSPLNETVIVTDTHYNKEDLEYFTVKRPTSQRKNVYVNWKRIPKPDQGHVHELIKEGTELTVKGFLCGNGGHWYAKERACPVGAANDPRHPAVKPCERLSERAEWRRARAALCLPPDPPVPFPLRRMAMVIASPLICACQRLR